MGPENVQSAIQGIGTHQYLGNKIFVAIIQIPDNLHAGCQTIHNQFKSTIAIIKALLGRFFDFFLLILNHAIF